MSRWCFARRSSELRTHAHMLVSMFSVDYFYCEYIAYEILTSAPGYCFLRPSFMSIESNRQSPHKPCYRFNYNSWSSDRSNNAPSIWPQPFLQPLHYCEPVRFHVLRPVSTVRSIQYDGEPPRHTERALMFHGFTIANLCTRTPKMKVSGCADGRCGRVMVCLPS